MQRRLAVGIAVAAVAVVVLVGAATVLPGLWVDVVGVGEYEEGTVTVREGTATAADPTATEGATDAGTAGDSATPATTVAVRERGAGEALGTVEVRIAETGTQRFVGLSETESLGPDEGMLFVHESEETHTYVMRNMSFPLDIIFVAENGTITTIHHAPTPPEGEQYSERYSGYGKYVLEVNRGWTNRTGVTVGDHVELPAEAA
ncbi:DUF192 domain-containing protein [Haloarcula salina]|uniref:DUF192 domain-containing protein n=1 Tax=Haloarcula salina TaxID=1429914 RepID=A0AA41G1D7_9EURY|nr:DUF192 domain-containing protein [Haloarcula salina]MBV0902612.1 DUF192 domain-containing protein [Haloarcula salina]